MPRVITKRPQQITAMRNRKMLNNKEKSTSKDFIFSVSLGSGKGRNETLLCLKKKPTNRAESHPTETVFDRTYFIR